MVDDGIDGGGNHYGAGGAVLSDGRHDRGWSMDLPPPREAIPPGPSTEPGPPPSGVGLEAGNVDDPYSFYAEYERRLRGRIETGKHEYGDASFHKSPAALVDEQIEEVLDIAGWAFPLYVRLMRIRHKLARAEQA